MKRLTSLCLSLLLMLGLSTFAFAACSPTKETAYDYLIYESTDGGIKITGYNEQKLPEDVVIPEKIGDKAVVSIGRYAFSECDKIKSVTVAGQFTEMEFGAFYRCRQLKEAVLPEKLKKNKRLLFFRLFSHDRHKNTQLRRGNRRMRFFGLSVGRNKTAVLS